MLLLLLLLLFQDITRLTINILGHYGLVIDSFHIIPFNVNFQFTPSFIFQCILWKE